MKRSRSSENTLEPNKQFKVERVENQDENKSSPSLKLKIKLTPEISKAIEPQTIQNENPKIISHNKEDKKVKAKNSKVKFSVPEPLVESLGIDVPCGKDIIFLNKLFHSPNAFHNGSVVKAKTKSRNFKCSVCNFEEENKEKFHTHISQHKSCESYFQCKECGASFAVEPSWRKHLLLMHRIKEPGPEYYCQELTYQENTYSYESEVSEDGELVIDTEEENHFKGQSSDVYHHELNASQQDHMQCDVSHLPTCLACGAQFSTASMFKEHKCDNSCIKYQYENINR